MEKLGDNSYLGHADKRGAEGQLEEGVGETGADRPREMAWIQDSEGANMSP